MRQPAIMSCPTEQGLPLPTLTSSVWNITYTNPRGPNTTAPRHLHRPRSLPFSSLLHCGPPPQRPAPHGPTGSFERSNPTGRHIAALHASTTFRNNSRALHHRGLPRNSTDTNIVPVKSSTMVGLSSAAGVVGYLAEPDAALQSFALQRLNEEIDLLWPEVAGSVSQM